MGTRFDACVAALTVLSLVALAFFLSTPWIELEFAGAAFVAAAVAVALARRLCGAGRTARKEEGPDAATVSKPSRR